MYFRQRGLVPRACKPQNKIEININNVTLDRLCVADAQTLLEENLTSLQGISRVCALGPGRKPRGGAPKLAPLEDIRKSFVLTFIA